MEEETRPSLTRQSSAQSLVHMTLPVHTATGSSSYSSIQSLKHDDEPSRHIERRYAHEHYASSSASSSYETSPALSASSSRTSPTQSPLIVQDDAFGLFRDDAIKGKARRGTDMHCEWRADSGQWGNERREWLLPRRAACIDSDSDADSAADSVSVASCALTSETDPATPSTAASPFAKPTRDSLSARLFALGLLLLPLVAVVSCQLLAAPAPPPPPAAAMRPQFLTAQWKSGPSMLSWLRNTWPVQFSHTHHNSNVITTADAPLEMPLRHTDAPERDTIVVYRILGNDLPPRHSPGQTLTNLRFLLEHESNFTTLPPLGPHPLHHTESFVDASSPLERSFLYETAGGLKVEKFYVLNRIVDPDTLRDSIALLLEYVPADHVLINPFVWADYADRAFRWDGGIAGATKWDISAFDPDAEVANATTFTHPEYLTADWIARLDERHKRNNLLKRLRGIDFNVHDKNLYAMNNNGGRNFALAHGRALPHARWVLPLDGNSFMTPAAMYSLVRTLAIAGEGPNPSRYIVIPMARMLSNDAVLEENSPALLPDAEASNLPSPTAEIEFHAQPAWAPDAPEEPQIGFRFNTAESFQEHMRYGRRSKLEFLWRLGAIPFSRSLHLRLPSWEYPDRMFISNTSYASIAGHASPLTSPVYLPHGFKKSDWEDENAPPFKGVAFVRASWVYRLFSGDPSQEKPSSAAMTLRNVNRIKGIINFIEALDERVARGFGSKCISPLTGQKTLTSQEGPFPDAVCPTQSFSKDRLWNIDIDRLLSADTRQRQALASAAAPLLRDSFADLVARDAPLDSRTPEDVAHAALTLAITGLLTGDAAFSTRAAQLVIARFGMTDNFDQPRLLQPATPNPNDPATFERTYSDLLDLEESSIGYAFPPILNDDPLRPDYNWSWLASARTWSANVGEGRFPFDPETFEPSPLLDTLRLLSHPAAPASALKNPAAQASLRAMAAAHLNFLLYSETGKAISTRPTDALVGPRYDVQVAALAAFLDDAKLVGRVANRARLRLNSKRLARYGFTGKLQAEDGGVVSTLSRRDSWSVNALYRPLVVGLKHIHFRPYDESAIANRFGTVSKHVKQVLKDTPHLKTIQSVLA